MRLLGGFRVYTELEIQLRRAYFFWIFQQRRISLLFKVPNAPHSLLLFFIGFTFLYISSWKFSQEQFNSRRRQLVKNVADKAFRRFEKLPKHTMQVECESNVSTIRSYRFHVQKKKKRFRNVSLYFKII